PLPSGGEGQGEGAGGGGPSRNPQTEILPLFARLSLAEQQRVFSVGSRRRIVLATNVAETSLTIPGIRYVIDSGLVRLNRYLPRRQIQSLQVEQVSQASAQQRRGRCGRVAEGVCVHLYAEAVLLESPAFTDPEIRRSSLAGVILQMAALELPPIAEFPFLDPPSRSLVEQGYRTLFEIGALDAQRQLTPLGRQLAQFPLDPQIGRMILQARDEQVVSEVLVLAAVLTIQDPRERPLDNLAAADAAHAPWRDPRSDFFGFLRLWNAWQQAWRTLPTTNRVRRWCKANYLSYRRIIEWQNLVRELAELVREQGWKVRIPGPVHDDSFYDRVHRAVIAGIPLQIGRREETMDYRAARGPAFYIFPGSALFEKAPPWVVAFALVETAKLYARVVGEINPEWVEQVAPHLCRQTHVDIEWDAEQGFVYAREIVSCGELTLLADRRVHYGRVDPATAREVFLREGMVPGNLRSGHAWRRDHQRLLDEIRTLEHKIRRPHGLLNEPAIFVHFDRLIPADVCSTRALDDWLHRERRDIRVPRAVALAAISDPVHEADWPDALTFPGHAFPLRYRCAPGEADDGITLVCSESLLASLPPWGTDWLVAGALPEKVRLLIRTLPKELWTACQPLPHTVEAFLQEVTNRPVVPEANPPHPAPQTAAGPASPPEGRGICRRDPLSPPGGAESDETPRGHGRQRVRVRGRLVFTGAAQSLTKALAQYLTRRLRMPVTAEQFAPDRLPEHLVMKVAVTDAAGKTLRVTRGRPAEAGYTSRLPAKSDWLPREWDRHGWTDWEGPALPESVPLPSCAAAGRAGYPALVDEGQTVGVRLFLDAGETQEQHAAGVVRLFRRCAAELVERFQKNLPVPQACQRALLALPGERGSALDDFVELLIEEVVRGGGPDAAYPRGPAVFRERVDAARSELFELASARADLLGRVMEQRAAALQAAGPVRSDAGAVPAVADIDRQLVFLFRPGFLGATDLLPHYPRYLRAVVIRLERLRLDPVKDRTKAGAVRPFQEQLDARWVKLQGRPPPSLLRFATLLQEYRVAQFAQELGTAEKVSPKRLQTAWEKVEAHG
ncbi:DUF3418 domain-containing protein, partial [bacterium]|nr:DUF3418 domain-containing protein [bacterium]